MDSLERATGTIRAPDGIPLFYRIWHPGTNGKGNLYLVHGLGEHSGRYVHVGQFFARAGYRCVAFDLRGHGRSGGKPVFVERYEELAEDLQSILSHFGGGVPFLFGHSLGGQLVLWANQHYEMNLAGLIASAPWLSLARPPPAWQLFAARLLNRIFPGYRFSTNLDRTILSHDLAHLDSLEGLELLHHSITVRLYFEAARAAEEVAGCPRSHCPVLVVQGCDDRVTSSHSVEAFFENLQAPSKTMKVYPGLYHELHNETERLDVLDFIRRWMDSFAGNQNAG